MIQHDSSYHRWSPYVAEKWWLITSLDDYSRYMLYADIVEKETTWKHITALESVWLRHGFPFKYYVDSHSIFRFIERRDSIWRKHHLKTDETEPQWKRIMTECRIQVTYALSPQAKGKVERPYRWLQSLPLNVSIRGQDCKNQYTKGRRSKGGIILRSHCFVPLKCLLLMSQQRIYSPFEKKGQQTPIEGYLLMELN